MCSADGFTAPSDKLNIAGVGVGGMAENLTQLASQNIVALCDVDWGYVDKGGFDNITKNLTTAALDERLARATSPEQKADGSSASSTNRSCSSERRRQAKRTRTTARCWRSRRTSTPC